MKTVKEISDITGVSVRTLRYYDKIGLLKPSGLSEAGYRLYDSKALERLQEILFFKELEIPLESIKKALDSPDYDKGKALLLQKALLERKRNRLNRIIELIDNVMEGVNTMSFEAFNEKDADMIFENTMKLQSKESAEAIAEKFGSIDNFREFFVKYVQNEYTSARLIKIYGSKDKALGAIMSSAGKSEKFNDFQKKADEIYVQLAEANKKNDISRTDELIGILSENIKATFGVDNSVNMLMEMARGYLGISKLKEITDKKYGEGFSEYIGKAIQRYCGV